MKMGLQMRVELPSKGGTESEGGIPGEHGTPNFVFQVSIGPQERVGF